MKNKILNYSLFALILISGFFSWFSVYNAPKIAGVSSWYISIASFSLYIIVMCLAAVLARQEIAMEIVVVISLLVSLIFAFSLWHFIILIFGTLLLLGALRKIRKDLDLNIKVDLWKSLYTGKVKIVWALAFIISSQYFFMINGASGQKVILKLDLSPITTRLIEPILVMVNPGLKSMQKDGLTVDQFIIQSQQKNSNNASSDQSSVEDMLNKQLPQNLPQDQREILKQQALEQVTDLSQKNNELVLQEGRKQLSQMSGHAIIGDEKVVDIFSGFIDKKINDFFQPTINSDSKSSFFPYLMVFILFLTILSLSVPLSPLLFGIVILVFKLFVRFGLVEIKTVTVQREMIV